MTLTKFGVTRELAQARFDLGEANAKVEELTLEVEDLKISRESHIKASEDLVAKLKTQEDSSN
jgi:hypothetical protein